MPFGALLSTLIDRHPEVQAVLFCDDEGEMVQLVERDSHRLDPFEIRVLGATASSWFRLGKWVDGSPSELMAISAKTHRHNLLFRGLPDGYHLCAITVRGAPRLLLERSLAQVANRLLSEM